MKNKNAFQHIRQLIQNKKYRLYYSTVFKAKTHIRRKINSLFNFERPTSYPHITGDGFRSIAQHVYDDLSTVQAKHVMNSDIVFVRADMLLSYFKDVHPQIQNNYILISHNSDENIDTNFTKYVDDKIIHWFAQNLIVDHPKCTNIPIGLQLRLYDKHNTVVSLLKKHKGSSEKKTKIFYAFAPETNKKRLNALDHLALLPIAETSLTQLTRDQYYAHVSSCLFNASPEGNGVDCHRTWESVYLGTIPIVERSKTTQYWQEIGLPIVLVDSWADVAKFDAKFLEEKYLELTSKFDTPVLYMDYWIKKITSYKK